MEKMYCFTCDKMVKPVKTEEARKYVIHNESFMVDEDVYTCPHCKEELIDESLDTSLLNIYDKYLSLHNLSIAKFRQIRESLNLSQELFANALGWSKKTINRYENGQSLPQKEYLEVYEALASDKDEILTILNAQKSKLGRDYYTIVKKLTTNLNIKTINTVLYLLYDNPLYETQIIKYLFAADFLCQQKENQTLTQLMYVHGPYGPLIDNRDVILNQLIHSGYLKLTQFELDKIKFVAAIPCDITLFSAEELKILDMIKSKFAGKTSKELSDWSHSFLGWIETGMGQTIDFKYAKNFTLDQGW